MLAIIRSSLHSGASSLQGSVCLAGTYIPTEYRHIHIIWRHSVIVNGGFLPTRYLKLSTNGLAREPCLSVCLRGCVAACLFGLIVSHTSSQTSNHTYLASTVQYAKSPSVLSSSSPDPPVFLHTTRVARFNSERLELGVLPRRDLVAPR